MIRKGTDKILATYINGQQVLSIYMQGQLIWPEEVLSCYTNGYWIDEYPWTDNTPWINSK